MSAKIKKVFCPKCSGLGGLLIFLVLCHFPIHPSAATQCYGTKMPERNKFFAGFESYSVFKRYQESDLGKLRSQQQFFTLSYGAFDWWSIDLKAGAGNIKQHAPGTEEISYASSFAGGYGLRFRLLEAERFKAVFGFHHISVHPKNKHVGSQKNKAILDDWQVSALASYDFGKISPYLGTRWSRLDYIHWQGSTRKRVMSDLTKDIGLIAGFNLYLNDRLWLNLEGQAFDSEACSVSLNYSF